jgi:hypothetical protein
MESWYVRLKPPKFCFDEHNATADLSEDSYLILNKLTTTFDLKLEKLQLLEFAFPETLRQKREVEDGKDIGI